jgi:Tfp pilus assembly protein PilO
LELRFAEEQQRSELLSTIDLQNGELKKQEKKILLQGGAPVLTSEVSRLASQTNFQIESVAPEPDLSLGPYTRHQIQVVATGKYVDLLRFLHTIEQHEPLLKVEHCEVGTPPQEGRGYSPYGRGSAAPARTFSVDESRQKATILISAFSRRGGEVAP